MFDISWSELLVIAVVAIVVIGPKDLPRVLRSLGRWTGQVKRMAREFQNQFNEALREAELDSVKRDLEEVAKIDPIGEVRTEMAKTNAEIMTELNKRPPEASSAVATPAPGAATSAAPAAPPIAPVAAEIPPAPPTAPVATEPAQVAAVEEKLAVAPAVPEEVKP